MPATRILWGAILVVFSIVLAKIWGATQWMAWRLTENVYHSPTGRFLLIPQGARLIGVYDSQIAFGQSRVLLVWNRIIFPNGNSIVLERQPGTDAAGFSGLEDGVDYHWLRLAGVAAMSTILGVGTQLGATSNDSQSPTRPGSARG
jgi:type IV secretory pathway VirB10-like protein